MAAQAHAIHATPSAIVPAPESDDARLKTGASRLKALHDEAVVANRVERAIVRALRDAGLGAERVPLSGSAGGSYLGDLTVPLLGRDLVVEVKARATGFAQLYAWLNGRDVLVIKASRAEPLVVLPLRLAAEIAVQAERVFKLAPVLTVR